MRHLTPFRNRTPGGWVAGGPPAARGGLLTAWRQRLSRSRLVGVAGAGVLLAATAAAPAFAQEPEVEWPMAGMGVLLPNAIVPAGGAGQAVSMFLAASKDLTAPTLTFDFTDLADVADVSLPAGSSAQCTSPSTGRLVCTDSSDFGLGILGIGIFSVLVTPATGAVAGDSGVLKVVFSATGEQAVTAQATIRVGEGVDLAAEAGTPASGAPGGLVSPVATVRNAGSTAVAGAVALFSDDYALRPEKHYSNCNYLEGALLFCRFTGSLQPGAEYGAPLAYRLGADTLAPSTQGSEVTWVTPAEFEDLAEFVVGMGGSLGTAGTDPAVELDELPNDAGMAGDTVQVDTEPTNNTATLTINVTGSNGADLVAVGDTVAGGSGDVVTANIGLVNKGPATLDRGRAAEAVTRVDVRVPEGTTAVHVPFDCMPLVNGVFDEHSTGEPGADAYRCLSDDFIKVGEAQTFSIALRVDKVVPDASGAITINARCADCGGITADLNAANDKASITVNRSVGTGGGGGGGGGPTLPVTGTATAPLVVAGVALLFAGAGLIVVGSVGCLTARRRTRRPLQS